MGTHKTSSLTNPWSKKMSQTANIKQFDKTTLITATKLKARGWTDALIHDLLGPPDVITKNPCKHWPTRLYDISRVEAIEAFAPWADRAKATRRRKEAKARAMEAMRTQLLSRLEAVSITVPILNEQELIRLACDHYNQRRYRRGDFVGREATPTSDIVFLHRIAVDYLRHTMSDYDAECGDIFGNVRARDGYIEINRKAYGAIATAYPTLAFECQSHLEREYARLQSRQE